MTVDTRTNKISIGFFKSIPVFNDRGFYEHVNSLTENQQSFVTLLNDWFQTPKNDIIVVSGSPGSGKTFTVVQTLKHVEAYILKMAYTGKVACNIGGFTIHSTLKMDWVEGSLLHQITSDIEKQDDEHPDYIKNCLNISQKLKKGMVCPSYIPNIIIIDEIGMISFWLTNEIINFFFSLNEYPKLFILMGDKYQLKPVKCKYNIFDIGMFKFKMIELDDNKRFTPDYNVVIKHIKTLIDQNDPDELFDYINSTYPILEDVYDFMLKECNRVLVYTNATAKRYNKFYIDNLPGPKFVFPRIRRGIVYNTDEIVLKENCNIVVNKNCEVPNGTFLHFITYVSEEDVLICKNPKTDLYEKISRDFWTGQFPVTLGFASTIHKYQGETIDESNILIQFDQCTDVHLWYTGLSRVRSKSQIFGVVMGKRGDVKRQFSEE